MTARDNDIDSSILALADRRRKVQRIVGTLALEYVGWGATDVSADTIADRVALMVKDGRLIAFGDIKNRRVGEICAANSVDAKDKI